MRTTSDLRSLQDQALSWLLKVYDPRACGWGWLSHIPPNEQNTAEAVVALLQHATDARQYQQLIITCVDRQLIESRATVTKEWIWVTYALLEVKKAGFYPDPARLDAAVTKSLGQVEGLWSSQEGGWPDAHAEPCQVTWTAITLILLHDHLPADIVAAAARFLARSQNADGGWGLWKLDEERIEREFRNHPRLIAQASSQILSNAAATAVAIFALQVVGQAPGRVAKGAKWLLANAMDTGGWPVFQQIGIRGDETYTWRHFSTPWAIRALLAVDDNYAYHQTIIEAVMYLVKLQDFATHGWRTSEDSDPFTWATCNALDALTEVSEHLLNHTPNMFRVISEWHQTRHLRENITTVNFAGKQLLFNKSTSGAISLLVTLLAVFSITLLTGEPKIVQMLAASILCLVAGLPWILYRKVAQRKEWSEAFILVYAVVAIVISILLAVATVSPI